MCFKRHTEQWANGLFANKTKSFGKTLANGQVVESVALTDGAFVHEFTYKVPAVVDSVTPSQGQFDAVVTIVGTELFGYGNSLASVALSGVGASIVTSSSSVVVVTAAASGATGSGAVTLTADTGAVVTIADAWQYVAVGDIATVSPSQGQLDTKVTMVGTDLLCGGTGLLGVALANVAAQTIESATSTQVVVVADGSNATATGDIVFYCENGGTVRKVNGFSYVAPPVFSAVTPNEGQTGTVVVITGSSLLSGATALSSVTLNQNTATIVSQNDTRIEVIAPTTTTAGLGDVVLLANTGAVATGSNLYTSLEEGDITLVNPSSGQGMTVVSVTGSNLLGGGSSVTISFNGANAAIGSFSNTLIQVVIAVNPTTGIGDIVITANTGATVTEANGWEQLVEGAVSAVTPNNGQVGTRVEISGARLLGGGSDLSNNF